MTVVEIGDSQNSVFGRFANTDLETFDPKNATVKN